MIFTYDPILVILSVVVSIVGAYSCFDLIIKIRKSKRGVDKKLLIGAAFAIGGSIWAMHFIAMLAVNLPIVIRYDALTTLVSGLVSVLMTAVALLIVSTGSRSGRRILIAGTMMGFGIASMHYIGMSSIRGDCGLSYSKLWIIVSIGTGIAASTASLWAAMTLRGHRRRLTAALVMGLSISGVHYSGMIGTTFVTLDKALELNQPILSPFSLGLVTAIATFIILGYALLTLVPESDSNSSESGSPLSGATPVDNNTLSSGADLEEDELSVGTSQIGKIPIQKNQKTYFIALSEVVSISADGHYSCVRTTHGDEYFCNHSLSRVEKDLDAEVFLRVHRSHIVNLNHIESFERQHDKGLVSLHNIDNPVPVSRANLAKLQTALGL